LYWTDADIISSYTRAQAIADGVLVDVTTTAKEAGIRFPVAITQGLWEKIVPSETDEKACGQSTSGRLWDVLYLFYTAARRFSGSKLLYPVLMVSNGKYATVHVKALVHPGDNMEPVITLMLPNED